MDKEMIIKDMIRVRISQIIVNERYKNKEFKVPIHLALGHEAISIAVTENLEENDKLVLTHRNIHYNLSRNKKLKPILDEYYLKEVGLNQGKTGCMNMINRKMGLIYTSSILGNNLSVATGISLANKMKNKDSMVFVVTGDGAMEEGSFYESMLFARSYHIPIVVIIENNQWSMHTRIEERRSQIDIKRLTSGLDIGYHSISNNNVFEYTELISKAKEEATRFSKPIVIEVNLKTLGNWIMENEAYPSGKYINYHAGPTPSVSDRDIILEKSDRDPLYVISKKYGENYLKKLFSEIKKNVEAEIA